MTSEPIEEIEHTADWAIRVRGDTLEELFANTALGMASLIADVTAIEPNIERWVELEEYDTETLLVSWLSELLWLGEESNTIFVSFDIQQLAPTTLKAVVRGGPATTQMKHIKAVTFHDMAILHTDTGHTVTVVFDV